MSYTVNYTVQKDCIVKDFLRTEAHISATTVKRAKYGGIRRNGETVTVRAILHAGDVLTLTLPEEHSGIEPMALPLSVVYEDGDILVLDKPCGMPMHPCRGNHLPTLANAVAARYGEDFIFRAVGRLDRDTSGLVVLAKHAIAGARLGECMKNGGFHKIYTAVVEGVPTPPDGRIDAPIGRVREGELARCVREDGKHAVTEYEVIGVTAEGDAIVRLKLLTGRTHQIRVHMAHIGHPLRDDFLYGTAREGKSMRLHATALSFPHPMTGQTVEFTSAPPFLTDNGSDA